MPSALDDDAFGNVAFDDLDTLTDRQLYDLNSQLLMSGDVGRSEQWRSRIANILISRI